MSSEGSRAANYSAAQKKSLGARKDKLSEDHQHLHEHFED